MSAMLKISMVAEGAMIFLFINIQPFFGFITAAIFTVYYIEMIKINVVNKYHGGSWKNYFRNILKKKQ